MILPFSFWEQQWLKDTLCVDLMNYLCFDRGNSVCWWHFPNALGAGEGLPFCTTQRVFPDQDFSPQRGSQGRDLCQRVEERLEGRAGTSTCITCKGGCSSVLFSHHVVSVQSILIFESNTYTFFFLSLSLSPPTHTHRQSSVFSFIRIRSRL